MDYVLKDGELCHARSHKYIKREWRNGRWVYWYDIPNTKNRVTLESNTAFIDLKKTPLTSKDKNYTRKVRSRYNVRKDLDTRISKDLKNANSRYEKDIHRNAMEYNRRELGAYAQELSRIENKRFSKRARSFVLRITGKSYVVVSKKVNKGKNFVNSLFNKK